jgi:glycosyltransferase involved in cell wall biosynthesis
MTIGIDYRLANSSSRGMARYAKEIVSCLLREDTTNRYILYIDKALTSTFVTSPNVFVKRIKTENYILGEQIFLALYTFIDKLDILWSPYNTFPLFARQKTRIFVTIHDLIFFHKTTGESSLYQKIGRLYRKYCLILGKKRINQCFTVSEYSAGEIQQRLSLQDISITPNCADAFLSKIAAYNNSGAALAEYNKPFYFTVSGDSPGKNLLFVVNYFKRFMPDAYLYIAGVPVTSYMRRFAQDNIVMTGYLSDEELAGYYKNCKAFLFLSLREGFGIPILEALSCGAKIIASNRTSIPEVAGNCAILIDPTSEEQFARALADIETFTVDEEYKKKHLSKYSSWKDTAKIVSSAFTKGVIV